MNGILTDGKILPPPSEKNLSLPGVGQKVCGSLANGIYVILEGLRKPHSAI